jgi:hypothetical protein
MPSASIEKTAKKPANDVKDSSSEHAQTSQSTSGTNTSINTLKSMNMSQDYLLSSFEDAISYLSRLDESGIFAYPVTEDIAPGYFSIIKHPMDLSTISTNLFGYKSLEEFSSDVELMLNNCMKYNHFQTDIHKVIQI